MRKILLVAAALFAGSAMAQSTGTTHMLEFNTDSVLNSVLSFDKSKTKGSDADNDTQFSLDAGYAYSLMNMPRLQLGTRVSYGKGTVSGRGDFEDYSVQLGVVLNHMADLTNSAYASLYLGYGMANTYGNAAFGRKDETRLATLAVGKRFGMERWGIKHLTYSPEIALQTVNSTTGSTLEYTQNLQFRILQFSALF